MEKNSRILLTNELTRFPNLRKWCSAQNAQLTGASLIEIQPIRNLQVPETDWIFFSSPKGAQAYLNHYPIRAKKVGAYGKGTAKILAENEINVHFEGEPNQNPTAIGNAFNAILEPKNAVLFPISQRSKKSILNCITQSVSIEFICYQTHFKPAQFTTIFDAIIFTSPSNFKSYISLNKVAENTVIIAMGETTATTIRKGIDGIKIHQLTEPNEGAMIRLLNALL